MVHSASSTYWFVQYGMTTQPYQFTKGSIFHLMEPDFCPTLPAWQKEFTWCIKVNNHKPLTFVVISSRTMMWLVN